MWAALPLLCAGAWLLGSPVRGSAAGLSVSYKVAGPSPPRVPWSLRSPSKRGRCCLWQNSSWWTAPRTSTTTAAKGASPARPSSISATTRASWLRTPTPTRPRTAPASSSPSRPWLLSRTWPTSPS
ncbi:cathepsin H [Rhinolophus ferrumequinum]|uniref:Cathepsin H n=1 Tax=Rhinolophus ferrumequinum TaxID=59479 RepID=A0A7J7RAX9_RHIFE|nr:cathepsin H [Rhinolophus ferrumequinum]